jgi:hypothetical protein
MSDIDRRTPLARKRLIIISQNLQLTELASSLSAQIPYGAHQADYVFNKVRTA